jgi:hypothetical protein
MRAIVALSVVVIAFAIMFIFFVMSTAPWGVVDFLPPSGNFTGTTTVTTTYGYACVFSDISGGQAIVNSTVTTLTGVGGTCYPRLEGYLQLPLGPDIVEVWLVGFAAALGGSAYYFHRKAQRKSVGVASMQ